MVADGVRSASSEREAEEASRFREESRQVREALLSSVAEPPPFEYLWMGVERRVAVTQRPAWWRQVLERKTLALVPTAVILVVLLITILISKAPIQSNVCYVDYYEADEGSVLIEQDPDDPARPTVIWHLMEG